MGSTFYPKNVGMSTVKTTKSKLSAMKSCLIRLRYNAKTNQVNRTSDTQFKTSSLDLVLITQRLRK